MKLLKDVNKELIEMANDIGMVHKGTMMPRQFKCVQLKHNYD